jgi:hypothetical protein
MRITRTGLTPVLVGFSLVLLGACGENMFTDPGVTRNDAEDPSVTIQEPNPDQRVAAGDSVFIRVDVSDDAGIERVELSGFALRGSEALGTLTAVTRFEPKIIDLSTLSPTVRDTTLLRFLVATPDSVSEDSVFVVATVFDVAGNEAADTIRIGIGGPRVRIVSPVSGTEARAGSDIRVRITATDTLQRLLSVRLTSTGALTLDTILRFDPPRTTLDSIVSIQIPTNLVDGTFELRAVARNAINDSTVSQPVSLRLQPAAVDQQAPTVRFRVTSPARAERNDSVTVTVVATDETRIDRVGVTLLPIHRLATRTDTLTVRSPSVPGDSATFRISLEQLGFPVATDSSTLRVEVTAFAFDAAGNCASATVPNTPLSEACPRTNPVFGVRPGARIELLAVRGRTIPVGGAGDRIADLAADATNLYLSNITRNRLEVVPIGSTAVNRTIAVGSRPWGLAFNANNTLLYVGNSGGTNISVVSPVSMTEVERIQTPNVKLYDVTFEAQIFENPDSPGDSISGLFPSSVERFDYSDHPQFIGVTQNENLIFSTLPTAAARDGTVRVHRRQQDRLEIVTDYAENRIGSKVVIANADSAFLVEADPDNLIRVCPRNRSANPALDRQLPQICYTGPINSVEQQIAAAGYDTRFNYGMDIAEIGLSDTTFVAVSGDHSTVAFGEGARNNARVMSFVDPLGLPNGPLAKFGEIRDLVGNTAERIIGLGLNADGSLGVARGTEAFFFNRELRLQGVVETEAGFGGVDMHPDNPAVRLAFVSGVEANGLAYIDVMDTFHFGRVARIFLRDPVTGPVRALRDTSGQLKIYAVTARGLVVLDVNPNDL